jgi:transmembrane E3 ubiquitin-protein ligase
MDLSMGLRNPESTFSISWSSVLCLSPRSRSVIDIRMLPSLVPESVRNETAHAIEPELRTRISKLKTLIDSGVVDQDNLEETRKSSCSFSLYAQLQPTYLSEAEMCELEDELQNPTGATTARRPKLSLDGLLLSQNCGILYEVKDTEGLRSKTFFRKITTCM